MSGVVARRPRLARPFTVVAEPGAVRLVSGEDHRYTLSAPGIERWLPGLLAALDGRTEVEAALALLAEADRAQARELLLRLEGERVLVEGTAAEAHEPLAARLVLEGQGPIREELARAAPETAAGVSPLHVLCQDRLDLAAALDWNRRRLEDGSGPWLWATTGPEARGYVSPVFLGRAGPCLACLLGHFRRLSPAPEILDALVAHARRGRAVEPVPFPEHGAGILARLVLWKASLLVERDPGPALYRLHVLETADLEVSSHRVRVDPECDACRGRRP